MKIIEIRRHSIRAKNGEHLNQQGVTLARLVGQNLGLFDRVITSTKPRAFETAIAMGFAVDDQNELISAYDDDANAEAPWPQSFATYAEVVTQRGATAKYAKKLAAFYSELADYLADERAALVINHGGVVELGVVACLPGTDFGSWGGSVDHCEGAKLYWDDGRFIKGEVLRVSI